MGYIRNDAVVVRLHDYGKGWEEAAAALDAVKAAYTGAPDVPDGLFIGPTGVTNGGYVYALLPDGSKEGWATSDFMNDIRDKMLAAARLSEYAEVVHLQFGGDDAETRVIFTTDPNVVAKP